MENLTGNSIEVTFREWLDMFRHFDTAALNLPTQDNDHIGGFVGEGSLEDQGFTIPFTHNGKYFTLRCEVHDTCDE